MPGVNTRIERHMGWRFAVLLGLLIQLTGWALPNMAQAQSNYGAPYTNNWDYGSYSSPGAAAAAYINDVNAACNAQQAPSTCVYSTTYYDANARGGLAASAHFDVRNPNGTTTSGNSSPNITGTPQYDNSNKTAGAPSSCPCAAHQGSTSSDSSPRGSSGDSAQDAQPSGPGAAQEGDPINASTGNKFEQDTDFRGSTWLTFRRFYNSRNATVALAHLGPQWRHTFDRALEIQRSPAGSSGSISTILADRPDGMGETFTLTQGAWVAQADNPDTLTEQDDANGNPVGYLLTIAAARQTESYFPDGRLNVIHDLATNQDVITTTYSTATTPITIAPSPNLLIAVADASGRTLNFTYDSSAKLHTVIQPDGGVLTYAYDASTGNLLSVQYPDGNTRQYVYNESALNSGASQPHAMTGVIDEANSRFESTGYLSNGKAYTTGFAGNVDKVAFAYQGVVSNGAIPVKITTPLGITPTLYFKNVLGGDKPASNDTACGLQCNETNKSATYDANGYPTSVTDFNNVITGTTYDANGLLDQEIDASGTAAQRTINTTWNTALRVPLTRVVLNAGGTTVASMAWVYNARGQATAQCAIDPAVAGATTYTCGSAANAPAGVRQTRATYCDAVDGTQCPLIGLPLTVDGPRTDVSDITTYTYYLTDSATAKHGDLQSITDALGHTTTILSHDGAGRVLTAQDSNGITTTYTYYPRGWLHTRSTGGATTTLTYTAYGAVQTITDPDGIAITYGYDAAHRLTTITDAQGNYVQYTLDASGNRTQEQIFVLGSTTASHSLSRTFNTLGQLTKVIDGLNHTVFNASTSGNYDGNSNLVQSVDALSVAHKQGYDALNRLTQTIGNYNGTDTATKNTTSGFAYDALGRLTGITDPSGLTTTYGYDGLSNRTNLQSPDAGSSSDTYDAAGNRLTHTDARGIVSTTAYDAINRPISTTYADSTLNLAYAYDEANSTTGCTSSNPIGRLTRVIENAITTVYCYDTRGNTTRKQQITSAATDTTSYTYSSADRLATITEPSGSLIAYGRDSMGRISSVTITPSGGSASMAVSSVIYLPFGPISGYTLGNGQVITRTYDANYALSDLTSPALNQHFSRDAMGNITAEGNSPGASPAVETDGYDPLYRIKSITDGTTVLQGFTYNPTGDRLSKTGSGLATGTYGYQANTHWLTTIGSAARTYDANGNTTAASSAGQTWGYGYNGRNRLTVVQAGGSTVGTYTYNAMGQRIQKFTTAPTAISQRFAYDEQGDLVGEYTAGGNNRDTIWLDDLPVATVDTAGATSAVNYIIGDELGTPRIVANGAGATIWSWPYVGNVFGELAPTSTTGYVLNLRFPGQYYNAESGMVSNGFRDCYEPATGRYCQSDPIGLNGGVSTYNYVGANPLSNVDPLGLDDTQCMYARASCGMAEDVPAAVQLPHGFINFSAGLGDALLLGTGPYLRRLIDVDGGVDPCSTAYKVGGWSSFALGGGRLAYAGIAKGGAILAASGIEASAFRQGLKSMFRFGAAKSWRAPDLSKYATDEALRAAAGKTSPGMNAYGTGVAAAGAAGAQCGCPK